MPPRVVWEQAHYLYNEKWMPEVDNMFIDLLVDHAMAGQFQVGANNSHSIEVIQWIICTHFQKDFTFLDCKRHVKKVQKRHQVFDWLVYMAGVLYDISTNTLIGAPFVWDHICTEQPFAYAYRTHGDPKWRELYIIFNDAPNSLELSTERIIDVTSSPDEGFVYVYQNGKALFGPLVQGIPIYDIQGIPIFNIPSDENDGLNAPLPIPVSVIDVFEDVINLESGGTSSPDMAFWNDVLEGFVSDSGSDLYGELDAEMMFPKDEAMVWVPQPNENVNQSPTSSLGYLSPSFSSSNSSGFKR